MPESMSDRLARVLRDEPSFWRGDTVYHVTGEGRGVIVAARFDGSWMYLVSWGINERDWHYENELSSEEVSQYGVN